jgi:hypothetical protein
MRREVEDERAARGAAEEARARAEADRNRLQVARDDLAAALRVAEQRAEEAAEDQVPWGCAGKGHTRRGQEPPPARGAG